MSERSLKASDGFREGSQKFDYYITTLTGAVFAYEVQNYKPQRLAWNFAALEPLALVLLIVAFFFGLQRIAKCVQTMGLNADALDAAEKAGTTAKALSEISGIGLNTETGDLMDRDMMIRAHHMFQEKRKAAHEATDKAASAASVYYELRNIFLYAGFIALFLAKVLQPYQ